MLFLLLCLDWPMMRKLDGGTHTREVYLTVPLEWQGAGSGCWLGCKEGGFGGIDKGWVRAIRAMGMGRRAIIATESPKRKTRLNVTGCEGIVTFCN